MPLPPAWDPRWLLRSRLPRGGRAAVLATGATAADDARGMGPRRAAPGEHSFWVSRPWPPAENPVWSRRLAVFPLGQWGGRKRAPPRVPLAERDRERIAAAPCGPQRGIRAGQRVLEASCPSTAPGRRARRALRRAGGGIRPMPGGGGGRGRRQEGSWSSGASDARAHALFLTLSILSMPVTCL